MLPHNLLQIFCSTAVPIYSQRYCLPQAHDLGNAQCCQMQMAGMHRYVLLQRSRMTWVLDHHQDLLMQDDWCTFACIALRQQNACDTGHASCDDPRFKNLVQYVRVSNEHLISKGHTAVYCQMKMERMQRYIYQSTYMWPPSRYFDQLMA